MKLTKTILITGASSGIGRALAEHLASLQYNVIAIARNQEALEKVQTLFPDNIKIIVADITKKNDQLKIKNAINSNETGIMLVHNAGIALPHLFVDLSEEEWDRHYETNTKAPIFITQLLLPHLKNGGRVLNVSSGLAHHSLPGLSAYGVSKSALYAWKEYCNAELRQQGILFGSAMPGIVDTPIQEYLRSQESSFFPAVEMFKSFFRDEELLQPMTVARFLTWILLEVDDEKFITDDWNINDTFHHQYWAAQGEVKARKTKN
jgi:short-subunit dehydrogenase